MLSCGTSDGASIMSTWGASMGTTHTPSPASGQNFCFGPQPTAATEIATARPAASGSADAKREGEIMRSDDWGRATWCQGRSVDTLGCAPYARSFVRRLSWSLMCLVGGTLSLVAVATRAAAPAPARPAAALAGPAPFTLPAGAARAIVSGGPPPPLLKLADVRPGMTGVALTVFQGTKPEPFKIRVVAVLKQFLPKEDVILIRAEDPRVEHSGIVAGMSGSPVYIEGKLVGAIAYAWSFAKEPLGGVTPIESMLAERARPRRKNPADMYASDDETDAARGLPALAAAPPAGGAGGQLVRA